MLAGSAVALALQAATSTLLILFAEETTSLFAWGSGSLSQLGLDAFQQAAPVVVVATGCALLLARRLDLLGAGRRQRRGARRAGPRRPGRRHRSCRAPHRRERHPRRPIGFVGLFAPVIVRLVGRVVPALNRHVVLIPAAGLMGAFVVVLADALLRAFLGADEAISIPTGITTTIAGAIVMIVLARRGRDSGPGQAAAGARVGLRSRRRFVVVLAIAVARRPRRHPARPARW